MVLAMIVLSAIGIGAAGDGHGGGSVPVVLGSGVAMVALVVLFVRYVANPLTERLAHAPELLVIFAIAMAAMFAAAATSWGWARRSAGFSRASRSRPRRIAKPSRPALRHCATSCCCSFSSPSDLHWICRFWARMSRRDHFLVVRSDREPADRARDHGGFGLPQADWLSRRSDGRADQRVFSDLRGHGCFARPCAGRCSWPCHHGWPRDHRGLHLHDHLFAPALCRFRAVHWACSSARARRANPPRQAGIANEGTRSSFSGWAASAPPSGFACKSGASGCWGRFQPLAIRRWRNSGLTEFGDATDPNSWRIFRCRAQAGSSRRCRFILPASAKDTRTTLIQLTRTSGFRGRGSPSHRIIPRTPRNLSPRARTWCWNHSRTRLTARSTLCGAPVEEADRDPVHRNGIRSTDDVIRGQIEGENRNPDHT